MTRTLRRGASQTDGMLRWKSNEAWPWDAGAIDIKKALGVWLLGPPGWRRLDIILPEHRWTLAADNDEVLQKWVKLLEDVAPEKPVSEIRNGWMEKKGAVGGGWKLRFFVLLSSAFTHAGSTPTRRWRRRSRTTTSSGLTCPTP